MKVMHAMILAAAMAGMGLANGRSVTAETPATAPAATQKSETPKELAQLIDNGIALLEAGKHREFIEALAKPEYVQAQKDKGEFDKMVEKFAASKAPALLEALKQAKLVSPTLTAEATRAEFFSHEEGKKPLRFSKTKDGWRLEN